MRKAIESILSKHINKRLKGFGYLLEAVELYNTGGDSLTRIYAEISSRHKTSAANVARCVAHAVENAELAGNTTPKAFIAGIKERIMFENDE